MTEITATDGRWRTRDILVVAVIAVAFGVFFWAFGFAWSALGVLGPAVNLLYGLWLLPALVAPLIVRRPGAALFAELVAASLSAFLGSQWAVDTLVSGLVQGAAAELVFAALRYRRFDLPAVIPGGEAGALPGSPAGAGGWGGRPAAPRRRSSPGASASGTRGRRKRRWRAWILSSSRVAACWSWGRRDRARAPSPWPWRAPSAAACPAPSRARPPGG